jgi:hypothetical protein
MGAGLAQGGDPHYEKRISTKNYFSVEAIRKVNQKKRILRLIPASSSRIITFLITYPFF